MKKIKFFFRDSTDYCPSYSGPLFEKNLENLEHCTL